MENFHFSSRFDSFFTFICKNTKKFKDGSEGERNVSFENLKNRKSINLRESSTSSIGSIVHLDSGIFVHLADGTTKSVSLDEFTSKKSIFLRKLTFMVDSAWIDFINDADLEEILEQSREEFSYFDQRGVKSMLSRVHALDKISSEGVRGFMYNKRIHFFGEGNLIVLEANCDVNFFLDEHGFNVEWDLVEEEAHWVAKDRLFELTQRE